MSEINNTTWKLYHLVFIGIHNGNQGSPTDGSKQGYRKPPVPSVGLSCQKHPGPLVREPKKVFCPSQKLSAQIFLPFLQLLELFL